MTAGSILLPILLVQTMVYIYIRTTRTVPGLRLLQNVWEETQANMFSSEILMVMVIWILFFRMKRLLRMRVTEQEPLQIKVPAYLQLPAEWLTKMLRLEILTTMAMTI